MALIVRKSAREGGADRRRQGPAERFGALVHGWPWLLLAAVVATWTALLVRLPGPAVVDPDGHASALYFERLVHGDRLEYPLLSTPKPLLTLTHGIAWWCTHDWRMLTAATVAAFALAVTFLARAAWRLAGAPAAIAVALAVAGSGALVLQVARANSVVWALAGWAVALDALARRPAERRWRRASIALLLAGLARSETWLLLPGVLIWVALAWRRGERAAAWLLLAAAAPALWVGHDWLLTGDALYSSRIPGRYTDLVPGRVVIAPGEWAAQVAQRYARPLAGLLALAGVVALALRRAWVWLGGLGLLATSVLALMGAYASQGVYVSWRYFDPSDTVVRVLVALGAVMLATAATGRLRRSAALDWAAGALILGVVATAIWPLAPTDPVVRSTLERDKRLSANAADAIVALRPLVGEAGVVAVSGPQRMRVALELGLPLTRVRDLFVDTLHAPVDEALAGTVAVYHDADGDRPPERFAALTRTTPGIVGSIKIDPVRTDPSRGLYVHRVGSAHTP
jgi:hypothetical protein